MPHSISIKTASGMILWFMDRCGFDGWASFWRTIYLRPGFENNTALIRHEQTHLDQIERDGRVLFSIQYVWWLARYGYWDNPYEVEARSREQI
jgi:hypothetical protein